jgi:superfamily II DNA or RNA helicase
MINIRILHDWCHVVYENDATELVALQLATGYMKAGAEDTEAFKAGVWDGRRTLFRKRHNRTEGKFPTGIYRSTIEGLRSIPGFRVRVVDERVYPYHPTKINKDLLTFVPRWFQEEGANIGLQQRRGVFRSPTASGKTKQAVSIIATLDLPTLWITHEGALGRTSARALKEGIRSNPEIGFYSGEDKVVRKFTVGLVQSLHKHRRDLYEKWLRHIKVIVLDEVHHGASRTWYDLAMSIPAPFRFGLSATPYERSDQATLELEAITGPLLYSKTPEEVREYLSRPNVEMIHLPKMLMQNYSWPGYYHEGIVQNELRNRVIIDRAMRSVQENQPGIIFVASRDHGALLERLLGEHIGVKGLHEYIHGDTPQYVRDLAYGRLRRRELRILIATDGVAGEGQDVPSVRRVIIGGGYKAAIIVKQRVGRGMRIEEESEGEDGWGGIVDIHDFYDNCNFRLLEHSEIRLGHYRDISSLVSHNYNVLQGLEIPCQVTEPPTSIGG